MPVHQISVMPVRRDFHGQGNVRTRKKTKENEVQGSAQEVLRLGESQPFATTSFEAAGSSGHHGPDHSTAIIHPSPAPVPKQQVKRRYRRQRKSSGCITECVDQSKISHTHNDSSSEDEQYNRAARSWSREKARRRRRPRVLTCSRKDEAQKPDLKPSQSTSFKMEELDSKSASHARESECDNGKHIREDGPIAKTYEERGSGVTDMAVPKAQMYAEASSQSETQQESCTDDEQEVCRICHSEGDEECPLITPCKCTGSLRFVHHTCLHQWIKSSGTQCCELCKYSFIMEMHLKPLRKWENLHMSTSERRRIFCSVIFHLAAMACITWSLYVFILLHHTDEGLQHSKEQNGQLDWIFWTKLGIVALSVIGGFIFMYIQCKVYHHLWRRLKAFNCVILVHNCQDTVCNGSEHIVPFPQTQATVPAGETAEVTPV